MGYFKNLAILQEEAEMGIGTMEDVDAYMKDHLRAIANEEPKMTVPSNEDIATHLQQIAYIFTKRPNDDKVDGFRSQTFSKAAAIARQPSGPLTNAAGEVLDPSRFGKKPSAVLEVIRQFVTTGTSEKIEKNLARLEAKGYTRDELLTRFDAKTCKRKVNELLAPLTEAGIDWGYAGSMRRGNKTVRDVDVIVCLKDEEAEREVIMNVLKRAGLSPDVRNGEQKIGVSIPVASQGRSFTLDLNFCHAENKGAYYLYYTGPKAMNIRMRGEAKVKGLLLNQYGLFDARGKCLASETEADMFKAMGWDFLAPNERA